LVGAWVVRFNKFITSVGYLTARENEVELLTAKFYMPEDQPLLALHAVTLVNFDTDSLSFALNLQHYFRHLWGKIPQNVISRTTLGKLTTLLKPSSRVSVVLLYDMVRLTWWD